MTSSARRERARYVIEMGLAPVLVVVLVMLLIVAAAGAVVTYVAYPARGRAVPHAPWLGEALDRGADKVGLTADDDARPRS